MHKKYLKISEINKFHKKNFITKKIIKKNFIKKINESRLILVDFF